MRTFHIKKRASGLEVGIVPAIDELDALTSFASLSGHTSFDQLAAAVGLSTAAAREQLAVVELPEAPKRKFYA
jgi:hypothetical protein